MTSVLVTVLICATAIYLWHRAEPLLRAKVTPERTAVPPTEPAAESIPLDLRQIASRESEPWAQQDVLAEILQRYGKAEGKTSQERWDHVRKLYEAA